MTVETAGQSGVVAGLSLWKKNPQSQETLRIPWLARVTWLVV